MPSPLISCPACHVYVRFAEDRCPHCGETYRTCRATTKAAGVILLGLAMSATHIERSF